METTKEKITLSLFLSLITVCLAQIAISGDNFVLALGAKELITRLNASANDIQLANVIYSLLAGSLMIFGGMLGIAKGFKKIFLTGAALCFLGEMLTVVSPNIEVLTWGARLLTGIGGAFIIPSVLGIIVSLFSGVNRAFALGLAGSSTGVAVIVVPVIAGLIMDHFGYKVAFSILAIWFLLIFVLAVIFIPSIQKNSIKIDYIGTIMMFIGLISFMVGCAKISVWGLIEPLDPPFLFFGISPAIPLIIFGVIVVGFTLAFENYTDKKEGSALIPRSFVQTRQVRNGIYAISLIFLIFGALLIFLPSWIMVVSKQTSAESGFSIMFVALPMTILSTILPKKFPHLSPRYVCIIAALFILVGCIFFIYSLEIGGYNKLGFYGGLTLMGIGMGSLSSQGYMIVSVALNPRDAAQSSGIQVSARNIWEAGAMAIVGVVFLFSMTGFFKTSIAQSDLPQELKTYVGDLKVVNLKNTDDIKALLQNSQTLSDKDLSQAVGIYNQATLKSARLAFWVLFILVALHIPGFLGIQKTGWVKKKINLDKGENMLSVGNT